ncbi:MAG: hypothetical protein U0641_14320 [Anaerolineae bacterium]
MHTMRHTPHWFHPRAALLALLAIVAVYVVWIGVKSQAQIPAASAPVAVQAVAGPAPVAVRSAAAYERDLARLRDLNTSGDPALDAGLARVAVRSAAAYERDLARLRDLNTSGDPALDAGLLPLRAPGQQGGPF